MNQIVDWAKQICIFYIITNLLISIIPGRHFQEQCRIVTGIMLIVFVLSPVCSLKGDYNVIDRIFQYAGNILSDSDDMLLLEPDVLETHIESEIEQVAWDYAICVNKCSADVSCDGISNKLEAVTIYAASDLSDNIVNLKQYICKRYGLNEADIAVYIE